MSGEARIVLQDVTVRFRMSYDRVVTMREMLSQAGKRILRRWQPEYFTALNGVNLTVENGDIVGVLGRNGAGKSTLLRTISGIYYPDGGSVRTHGRVSALLQLGTGFNTALPGRENIILGGLTLGYSLGESRERMELIMYFW